MNVELVVGQEVLGRHANGMASRPQSAGHWRARRWRPTWGYPRVLRLMWSPRTIV